MALVSGLGKCYNGIKVEFQIQCGFDSIFCLVCVGFRYLAGGLGLEFNALWSFTVAKAQMEFDSILNLVPLWREIGFEFNLPRVGGS